ncbi:unnamed protein product [Merluccius merluccius]
MQSDDLFIRKFRRQNVRPPVASVNYDAKRERGVVEWPPRRESEGADPGDSLTPSRAGLTLRSAGRGGHIMQRSNSDVTLGDLDSSGKAGGKAGVRAGGEKAGAGAQGDAGPPLHREYGSLSSLERRTHGAAGPHSDERGPLSPNALRFKDPFLLLGLRGNPPEPDGFFHGLSASAAGDCPKPAKPPKPEGLGKKSKPGPPQIPPPGPYDNLGGGAWVRNFAHYDVQSILLDLTEAATNRDSIGRKKNITSGASAASQLRPLSQVSTSSSLSQGGGGGGGGGSSGGSAGGSTGSDDLEQSLLLDEGDGNDNELLLSCPHFRNEMGGEERVGLGRSQGRCQQGRRGPWLSSRSPNDAVSVLEEPRESHVQQQGKSNYFIEHADLGAHYYRKYFYMKEHQNFFGIDDRLGPVAISFRREEKEGSSGAQYNYRIIFRTTELKTLRGSILEESVPSAARHTTPRGLSPKRLLEFIIPELNLHCLRLASNSPKVRDTLLKLDEQGLNFQRKVGVMYCRAGQSSEEDMYNNESSGPAFEEFLDLLGERVRLKGWEKYRAQLDNKTDSTGTHSLYTRYQDYEIMFHVSTMLPYTANNTQQLLRKRHIGNDIVTIVFQEPGALPFTPRSIRSHFQHVFIIVQVHQPGTPHTSYRVAVTRSKDIPLFGPLFPRGARFPRCPAFRDFLLAKAVNAENAAEKAEKFRSMATRTRQEYLKDLAENYVTTTPIDSSTKFPLLSLGSKRKDKLKGAKGAELHSAGALVWAVLVSCPSEEEEEEEGEEEDGEEAGRGGGGGGGGAAEHHKLPCLLGVSAESVVLIERYSRRVVFNCSCRDVIGWKAVTDTKEGGPCLDIFYERGESVSISVAESQAEDIREVVQRLEVTSTGDVSPFLLCLLVYIPKANVRTLLPGCSTSSYRGGGAVLKPPLTAIRVLSLSPTKPLSTHYPPLSLLRTAPPPPPPPPPPSPPLSALLSSTTPPPPQPSTNLISQQPLRLPPPTGAAIKGGQMAHSDLHKSTLHTPLSPSPLLSLPLLSSPPLSSPLLSSLLSSPLLSPLLSSPLLSLLSLLSSLLSSSLLSSLPLLSPLLSPLLFSPLLSPLLSSPLSSPLLFSPLLSSSLLSPLLSSPHSSPLLSSPLLFSPLSSPLLSSLFSLSPLLSSPLSSPLLSSLHHAVLSETTESTEEEWQSIADVATACRSILEALSREDRKAADQSGSDQTDGKLRDSKDSDSPGHLEEKVSQLENMLKRLQDDLQKEKEDKAVLQAEVQSLRQNNQRLQEESQSTVARLIKVTELLCNVNKPC